MTDGITAVHRDKERGRIYEEYLDSLVKYLGDSSERNYSSLREIAEKADSIRGGYFTGETYLAKTLDKKVNLLINEDEITWLRFLSGLTDVHDIKTGTNFYNKFLKLSPFSDDNLTFIRYGCGFMRDDDSKGSLLEMVHDELRQGGIETFSGGSYAVILPEETIEKMRELIKGIKVHDMTIRTKIVE